MKFFYYFFIHFIKNITFKLLQVPSLVRYLLAALQMTVWFLYGQYLELTVKPAGKESLSDLIWLVYSCVNVNKLSWIEKCLKILNKLGNWFPLTHLSAKERWPFHFRRWTSMSSGGVTDPWCFSYSLALKFIKSSIKIVLTSCN